MIRIAAIMLAALLAAPAAMADDKHHSDSLADGEIRKVDKDAKKITIKHGEIKSIDMPPMTMVFQVKDSALLDKVKAGDKIKFAADKVGGTYTVNQLDVVK